MLLFRFLRYFCDIAFSCLDVSEAPSMHWVEEWVSSTTWTRWTWTTQTSTSTTASTFVRSSDSPKISCHNPSPETFKRNFPLNSRCSTNEKRKKKMQSFRVTPQRITCNCNVFGYRGITVIYFCFNS